MLGNDGSLLVDASQGSINADDLLSAGDLTAQATQNIAYLSLQSGGAAALTADQGTISLDKRTHADGDITVSAQLIDLSNGRSGIDTAGTLKITADNANFSGSTLTFGGLDLNLTGAANVANARINTLSASGGTGDLLISASTLSGNANTALLAQDDLALTLASLGNAGQIAAGNNLTLNVSGNLTNSSTGLVYAGGDVKLFVLGDLVNDQGAILAGTDLTIAGNAGGVRNRSLTNIGGLLQSGNDLSVLTNNLTNRRVSTPTISNSLVSSGIASYFALNPDVAGKPFAYLESREQDIFELYPGAGTPLFSEYEPQLWSVATLSDGTSYRAWTWISGDGPEAVRPIFDWIKDRVPKDANGNPVLDPSNPSRYFIVDHVISGGNPDTSTTYSWDGSANLSQSVYQDHFDAPLTAQGLIHASGDLSIDATNLTNAYSAIEAGGNATLKGSVLDNQGVTLTRTTMTTCHADGACSAYDASGNRNPSKDIANGTSIISKVESIGGASATIKAGGNVNISGFATVNNSAAAGSIAGATSTSATGRADPTSALSGMTAGGALFAINAAANGLAGASLQAAVAASTPKPQSGGFGGTIPGQTFLYETRAAFLDVDRYYGSGYFVSHIGYQPDNDVPFLGDAYFENQYIDQQLRQNTGEGLGTSRFIPGSDIVEQVKTLLDNGLQYAEDHNIKLGQTLSPEQIAALTQPLVWYEHKTVDGVEVLAPVVYVPSTEMAQLTAAGALISGSSVTVEGGAINNSGAMVASNDLSVSGKSIATNGGSFKAGGDLALASSGTITLNAQSLDLGGQKVVNPNAAVSAGGHATLTATSDINLKGAAVEAGGNLSLSGSNVTLDTVKVENGSQQNATGAQLSSGGTLTITANDNVNVIGSSAKAGTSLDVTAQNGSVNVVTTDLARQTDDGYSKITSTDQQESLLSAGGDATIKSGKDILLSGSSLSAGNDVSLQAADSIDISVSQSQSAANFGKNSSSNTTHTGSEITAGGAVSATAGDDINIIGSKLAADDTVRLKAGDDVTIAEATDSGTLDVQSSTKSGGWFGSKTTATGHLETESVVGSSISGKGGIDITSGGNTTISASKVQAGDEENKANLNVSAGGDLVIASGTDTVSQDDHGKKKGFLSKGSSHYQRYDEATIGSEIGASGNISLNAGNAAVIEGSKVTAEGAISASGDSLSIIGAQEKHELEDQRKKSGLFVGSGDGFFSIWGNKQNSGKQSSTLNIGSELSAGTDVTLTARDTDLNIIGSGIEAGRDIALSATRDVNITPGAESFSSEEKEKRSGFGISFGSGGGGVSIGIGVAKASDKTTQGSNTNAASTLTAGRDLTITAGRDANLQAAQVEAERDVAVTAARDVNLLSAQDATNYEHIHKELFAGITAQVSSGLVSAAQGVAESMEAAGSASGGAQALANAAMAALYANKLKQGLDQISQNGNTGISASVSIGFQSSKTEERSQSSTPVVTNIRAGDSVTIDANSGDINSHGAQIIAGYNQYGLPTGGSGDITLDAGNDINLESAVATGNSSSQNSSFGASVGIGGGFTVGAGGIKPIEGSSTGISVSANGSKGSANQNTTTHVNTHVAGAGTVSLNSNNDTNLKGAVVSGESVKVDAGGDLNIESQVDTASSKAQQTSVGGSIGNGGFNVSGSYQNAKGDAAVVSEQSGIHAGSGGFDINVEGNTSLKGGLITSEAPAKDNRLETGTLEFSDLDTHSKWKAETWGGSIGSGGISMAPPIKQGESETGKALSAVSPAEIVITNPAAQQQNIDDLRRDTTNTNTSLPGLPDLQKILGEQYKTQQRYQEAAQMMAEFVAEQADKLAKAAPDEETRKCWEAGGVCRAALHAVGGGILGGVNDVSGMIKAAFGGAAATMIGPYIDGLVNQLINDAGLGGTEAGRSLAKIVSGGIVMGLTSVVGGGDAAAYAGAEFRYNYLMHSEWAKFEAELKACLARGETCVDVIAKYKAISEAHEAEFAACGRDQACIDLHMTRIAAAELSHKTFDVLELLKPTGWSATFDRLQYENAEKIGAGSDMNQVWHDAGAEFRKEFGKASCSGLSAAACQKAFDEEVMRIAAVEAHSKAVGEGIVSFFSAMGIGIDMTPIGDAVAVVDCASSPSMGTCVAAVAGLLPALGDGAKILLKRGDTVLEVALDAKGAAKVENAGSLATETIGGKTCIYSCVVDGVTRYVGITDDIARRGVEHLREKGIKIAEIRGLSNLSRDDARAVEQVLINYYGLGNKGGDLLNKINSISSSKNPTVYEQALVRGKELLDSVNYQWTK
ncbi:MULTISPECIES: hemagglutinin repeat-containing protein [unclassified Sinorhizobium]|uniref:hemagglutinin repeat-containing protein n=1 Tax=unclassified Sinorhizobium TaxID=2613772 RepID=UPI0035248A4C